MKLANWLRKLPRPVAILADGQRLDVGKSPSWTELASTVEAMNVARVTLLGPRDAVLRARALDDGAAPALPASPELPDVQVFARLLAEAYANGAKATETAYQRIFEENTKLVRLLAERLGALEAAWQKSLSTHARLVMDVAEARADAADAAAETADGGGLGGALLQGMLAGQVRSIANAAGVKK